MANRLLFSSLILLMLSSAALASGPSGPGKSQAPQQKQKQEDPKQKKDNSTEVLVSAFSRELAFIWSFAEAVPSQFESATAKEETVVPVMKEPEKEAARVRRIGGVTATEETMPDGGVRGKIVFDVKSTKSKRGNR